MCGRFFRHNISREEYGTRHGVSHPDDIPEIEAAYNVAPTQQVPILRQAKNSDRLEFAFARWGLVPYWWKKPLAEKKFSTFNAKCEEAAQKSSYRSAWQERPCLIPMSGYYEWKGPKGTKQPYAIALKNRRWFYVCGLWDRVHIDDKPLDSFTILTTTANDLTATIHPRMPVIPEPSEAVKWVSACADERMAMIGSCHSSDMHLWEVTRRVGNIKNQGPELITPIDSSSCLLSFCF